MAKLDVERHEHGLIDESLTHITRLAILLCILEKG
jgi:hypothetical protein